MQERSTRRIAFLALVLGATGIGFAPIFVRLSEVGPSATAFYRLFFSLPVLWLAVGFEPRAQARESDATTWLIARRRLVWLAALAGALFAGDLAFWHWSIRLTSVANSTLLTNCAPFVVLLGARVIFHERITLLLILGMAVAAVGAALLVGTSLRLTSAHLLGDFLGLITAFFYGSYLLTVKYLRRSLSPARILALSGIVSCVLLLAVAVLSKERLFFSTSRGFLILLSLAVVSHLGGQGFITYALAHLPAGFSSVSLLLQPVVAAILAWIILAEPLSLLQALGGGIILLGIGLAGLNESSR